MHHSGIPSSPLGRGSQSRRVTRTALKDTPHEGLVAGTSEDGKVFVWRADDGELLHTFELPLVRETVSKIALPSPRAVTLGRLDDRTIVRRRRAARRGHGRSEAATRSPTSPGTPIRMTGRLSPSSTSRIPIAHMTEEDRVEVVDVLADVTRFRTRAYEHLSAIEFLRSEECGTLVALSSDDVIEILDVQEGHPKRAGGQNALHARGGARSARRRGCFGLLACGGRRPVEPVRRSVPTVRASTTLAPGAASPSQVSEACDVLISAHTQTVPRMEPTHGALARRASFRNDHLVRRRRRHGGGLCARRRLRTGRSGRGAQGLLTCDGHQRADPTKESSARPFLPPGLLIGSLRFEEFPAFMASIALAAASGRARGMPRTSGP